MTTSVKYSKRHMPAQKFLPAALALGLVVSGCQTTSNATRTSVFGERQTAPLYTGSTKRGLDVIASTTKIARKWQKNPGNAQIGLHYAHNLQRIRSHEKALSILRQTAVRNPQNQAVIFAYGKQLATVGQLGEADTILQKAHGLGKPNWRIYAAQGVVLDKMNAHVRAQSAYGYALKLEPRRASIYNNMGMSYALAGNLKNAEVRLRQARSLKKSDPKIRQNLGLVVGLQGRFTEAQKIVSADLPPKTVAANMAYLRSMLSQPDRWKTIKKLNKS